MTICSAIMDVFDGLLFFIDTIMLGHYFLIKAIKFRLEKNPEKVLQFFNMQHLLLDNIVGVMHLLLSRRLCRCRCRLRRPF